MYNRQHSLPLGYWDVFYFYTRSKWFIFQVTTLFMNRLCSCRCTNTVQAASVGPNQRRGRLRKERWMSYCCGRKEALVSPESAMVCMAVFHFSVRNAAALPAALQNTESKRRFSLQTRRLQQSPCCLFAGPLCCVTFVSHCLFYVCLCIGLTSSVIWHPPP